MGLLSHFFVFLAGMVIGAALAHTPLLWVAVIVLVAIAIALMGASVKPTKRKRIRRG
jgi:hypothetical protein